MNHVVMWVAKILAATLVGGIGAGVFHLFTTRYGENARGSFESATVFVFFSAVWGILVLVSLLQILAA